MKRKLYSISELIDENIRLKKQLEKSQIRHLKNLINILRLCETREFDVKKAIDGFSSELEDLE